MFELLVAFMLYQFDADPLWWFAFIGIIAFDFLIAFYTGYTQEN